MSPAAGSLRPWLDQVQVRFGGYSKLGPGDARDSRPSALASRSIRRFALLAVAVVGGIVFLATLHPSSSSSSTATLSATPSPSLSPGSVNPDTVSKHLVIASFTTQNVSWLRDVPSSWITKRYITDDPNPPTGGMSVPANRAREAMGYLTYIIDHYDRLPDYMVFTHGHDRSWHQIEPLAIKIRALNLTALEQEGYISLRCGTLMGCERQPFLDINHPNWGGETKLAQYWERIMPGTPPPEKISYKCCAQFAVTRDAVRRLTKEQWTNLRRPLVDGGNLEEYKHPTQTGNWVVGTFYEKWWHVWLTGKNEYCPSSAYCHQTHFSNAIACGGELDRTIFEGDGWRDVKCVSAFDHLDVEAPWNEVQAAIKKFNSKIVATYEDLRKESAKKYDLAMATLKEKEEAARKAAAEEARKKQEEEEDAERKRIEQVKIENEKAEQEKLRKEQAEKERLELETAEKEKSDREKKTKDRQLKEDMEMAEEERG